MASKEFKLVTDMLQTLEALSETGYGDHIIVGESDTGVDDDTLILTLPDDELLSFSNAVARLAQTRKLNLVELQAQGAHPNLGIDSVDENIASMKLFIAAYKAAKPATDVAGIAICGVLSFAAMHFIGSIKG